MVLIVLVIMLVFWFRNLKKEFEGFDTNKLGRKGERGDQGPRGNQGIVGVQGDRGEPGEDAHTSHGGWAGIKGFQGPRGLMGIRGEQGIEGRQGNRGRRGEKGLPVVQDIWNDRRIPPILEKIHAKIVEGTQSFQEKELSPINLNLKMPTPGKGKITAKYTVSEKIIEPFFNF